MKKDDNELSEVEKKLLEAEQRLLVEIQKQRKWVKTRHPFLFMLLVTFGAIATFQGFNRIVNSISLFADNPWIMFVVGISVLGITGTLYQKLK